MKLRCSCGVWEFTKLQLSGSSLGCNSIAAVGLRGSFLILWDTKKNSQVKENSWKMLDDLGSCADVLEQVERSSACGRAPQGSGKAQVPRAPAALLATPGTTLPGCSSSPLDIFHDLQQCFPLAHMFSLLYRTLLPCLRNCGRHLFPSSFLSLF